MKVLVGYVVDFDLSGIDKYLINVIKVAKENGIQLDFLTSRPNQKTKDFLAEFGFRVFTVSSLKNPYLHYKNVKEILKNEQYDRAYFNISEPLNFAGVKAASDLKVPTITHSHSSGMDIKNPIKRFLRGAVNFLARPVLCKCTSRFLACSYTAAVWLFGKRNAKRSQIIFNSVDSSKFRPDLKMRIQKRQELGIDEGTQVIGTVANFSYQKNNFFLAEILKETVKENKNVIMLLIGEGETKNAVYNRFCELGLSSSVRFLGVRNDVPELMRAMDVFVLPSRFEGLPIVAIEAQLSGVCCLLSNKIDRLCAISDCCEFLNIKDASLWAKSILLSKNIETKKYNEKLLKNFSYEHNKEEILRVLFS